MGMLKELGPMDDVTGRHDKGDDGLGVGWGKVVMEIVVLGRAV